MKRFPTAAALAAVALWALPAGAAAQTVALTGGRVLPISSAPIPGGTVLMVDGRIAAVGTDVDIPAGAEVVDVSGSVVMPGIIDAMTYYGIDGGDMNEVPNPLTPELRIIEAFYPFGDFGSGPAEEPRATELLAGGVTAMYIAPGDATIIGGQGAVVKAAAPSFADLIVREPAALDMTLGRRPADTYREQSRSPSTRMAVVSQLRDFLIKAQEHRAKEDTGANQDGPRNLGMEAVGRLLEGTVPARIQANAVGDINVAMDLAEEFGFELVIDGGVGAHRIGADLAERGIPVVVAPVSHAYISGEEIPDDSEYGDVDERNALWLTRAGVKVAFGSYSRGFGSLGKGVAGQWLLIDASIVHGHGMSEAEVLRALTLNAAEILGVDDRMGSLDVGKDANVAVFDGDPLSIRTWASHVYVDGRLVHERPN